ncbi:hypothetical protein ACTA71_007019 [Dictyostelium dimigraforme]
MLKINNVLLFVWILLVSVIKVSSSLELIVNSASTYIYTLQCGDSFPNACKNIPDAIDYYVSYTSTPENSGANLVLKLADGDYLAKGNSFDYVGSGGIEITTYSASSPSVNILGDEFVEPFIKSDDNSKVILVVSNIGFSNFNEIAFSFTSSGENDKSSVVFNNCKFSNGNGNFGFKGAASSSKAFNSIKFYQTTFKNVFIDSNLVDFEGYRIIFDQSKVLQSSLGKELISEDDVSISIDGSSFNDVIITGVGFISISDDDKLQITNSQFTKVRSSGSVSNLFSILGNSVQALFENNVFTDIDIELLLALNAKAQFKGNQISITQPITKSLLIVDSSEIEFDSNEINYPKVAKSIDCTDSTITFTDNTGTNYLDEAVCNRCDFTYNTNKFCTTPTPTPSSTSTTSSTTSSTPSSTTSSTPSSTTSSTTSSTPSSTTSSTPTTTSSSPSPSTTSDTTTGTHPNSAIESKSISYSFLGFILLVVAIFNI